MPRPRRPYRYNERDLHRAYADNCYATREFLMANYVRMGRISGTHGNGGMSRARRAVSFLMEGATTDIKKGTVSKQDAGIAGVSSSHFAPRFMEDGAKVASQGARTNGAALARRLEFSAREKGVRFILNRHMDEIIREQQFSGRVVGIRASYSPRFDPQTGARLESLWQNGNVDDRTETIYIRARKAIIIGAGGHGANPQFRSMFYPAWREPAFVSSGWALLGPRGQDASGIIAGMRVGANLAGMQQNLSYGSTFHFPGTLATRDPYTDMLPGHPTFSLRGSTGINLGTDSFQHLIVVNQVGKRFFNELLVTTGRAAPPFRPGPRKGQPKSGLDHVQLDWRNASVENIRATYAEPNSIHAALAMNEGSKAPDFFSGPIWAIFDRAAVERDKWNIDPPFTSPTNGFFFNADTIEELAAKIHEGPRVPEGSADVPDGNGGQVELVRGQGQRSGVRARDGCADAQDRQAAVLRGDALSGLARFVRRSSDQRARPGHRHAGRADSRPLCRRRVQRRRQPAWPGQSPRPWLHRRHERREGTGDLSNSRGSVFPAASATRPSNICQPWNRPS